MPYAVFVRHVLMVILLVVGSAVTIRKILAFRAGLFVGVTPAGLMYCMSGWRVNLIPWCKIGPIRITPLRRRRRVFVQASDRRGVDVTPAMHAEIDIENFVSAVRIRVQECTKKD